MVSKKKQRAITNKKISQVRVDIYLKDMRLRDLQREAILRGMDFQDMVSSSVLQLSTWLINNWGEVRQRELLDEFDSWMDGKLKESGNDDLIHPMLNLGFNPTEEEGKKKTKRIKGIRKEPVRKERTTEGVFKGTKKALTFELTKKGLDKTEIVKQVMESFPDAKEKSIIIWHNRMRKNMG